MKIVITVNTYYPLKDGVQAVTTYHAEALVRLGHEVFVITPTESEYSNEEIRNGVKIIRVEIHTVHALYVGNKREYRDLILRLTKDADAMINVCTQTAMTDLLYPIINQIHCKKILYMHGMCQFEWSGENFQSFSSIGHKIWNDIRWKIQYTKSGKYYQMYDHITQLHQFDAAYEFFQKRYGIVSDVLENAADNEFFEQNADYQLELPDNYAVCVANYIERKNQRLILEAFYKSKIDLEFELILIGSEKTDYYLSLKLAQEILEEKYGKRKVRMLFDIPRKQIPEYVKRSSVYLLGSKWEAFPISIIEAMAAGVSFITTDVGCVRFLPGGVVVKNAEEMSYWLELLVNNNKLRSDMGKIGTDYAKEHLSIEKKVKQLVELIRN